MKTGYVVPGVPTRFTRDPGDLAVMAAGQMTQSAMSVAARRRARERVEAQFAEARNKLTADTQPRDPAGKFRRVLARLKVNLGTDASEELASKIEDAEAAGAIGDYRSARSSAADVIKLIDNVEEGDIKKGTINNIRAGARDLGKLLAYLPLPQGDPNAKVRFSDLPDPTANLIKDMIRRVNDKLPAEEAAPYVAVLQSFMSGIRTMAADEMAAELSKLLRVLA